MKCLVKISVTQIVRPVQSSELSSLTCTLKSDLSGSHHITKTSLKVQTPLEKKKEWYFISKGMVMQCHFHSWEVVFSLLHSTFGSQSG